MDNDTVLGWLVDLGGDDGTLTTVGLVELSKLLEWVLADDVGVKDEEWGVVLL